MHNEFKQKLNDSKNILILTHLGMDHDAVCSVLLLKYILDTHYENKNSTIVTNEKEWPKFKKWNLRGLDEIEHVKKAEEINFIKYDLVLLVDVSQYDRSLKNFKAGDEILNKTVVIDHHTIKAPAKFALTINENRSSSAEQIFVLFRDILGKDFRLDKHISFFTQLGIVADTNRFLFNEQISPETFEIMAQLVKVNKLNLEEKYYRMMNNPPKSVFALEEIIARTKFKDDLVYSYLPKNVLKHFVFRETKAATGMFLSICIRTLVNVNWGFLVKPTAKKNEWRVMLRSRSNTKDVRALAEKLGGGGHINAASATILAKNAKKAVESVLDMIQ